MKTRPVHLKLYQIKFPITAIVSILHRVSGVLMFLLIPVLLWGFQQSQVEPGFAALKIAFSQGAWSVILWGSLTATIYHIFAGLRHLVMDMGYGDSWCTAKLSAWIVFALTLIYAAWLGFCLWG